MIKPEDSFEITHRFKPQKIDEPRFLGSLDSPMGNTLWWALMLVNMEANEISAAVTTLNSYSLSFSADAIGTT